MSDLGLAGQRDRFLAFAFAASDVLIEIDGEERVTFVAGSVKSLFAHSTEELMGTPIMDCAMPDYRVAFAEFLQKLKSSGRASDTMLELRGGDAKIHTVTVAGIASPQRSGVFHLAFRNASFLMRVALASKKKPPVSAGEHSEQAARTIACAQESGDVLNFAMFDVDLDKAEKEGLSLKDSKKLSSTLVQTIQAWAADGYVGEIAKGKYSVLLEEGIDATKVKSRMSKAAMSNVPDVILDIGETMITMDDLIDTDDFAEFLDDAMERFEESGADGFDVGSIADTISSAKSASSSASDAGTARPTLRPGGRRRGTVEGWG